MLGQADRPVVHEMVCPEIPVGDLAIEVVREGERSEALLPGLVQSDKIRNAEVIAEFLKPEVVEDFEVCPDRIGERDILDKGDFFEDVLGLLALVEAAVDDGERDRVPVPDEHERGHRERLVDCTGDVRECRPVVVAGRKLGSEEEIRLDERAVDGGLTVKEPGLVRQLRVAELEQEMQGGEIREGLLFFRGQPALRVEGREEVFHPAKRNRALGFVSQNPKQASGGFR